MPPEYDPGHYTILVLGASVAQQIAVNFNYQKTTFPPETNLVFYLEDYLNSNWISPNGKPFRVINAAVPGSHQPVNFIAAGLFADLADEVISIEGFNEHYGVGRRDRLETPSVLWRQLALPTVSPFKYFLFRKLNGIFNLPKSNILTYSSVYFALSNLFNEFKASSEQESHKALTAFPIYPEDFSKEKREKAFLESYKKYVKLTNNILRDQKKNYTLFIQPSPLYGKKLTNEEIVLAGADLSERKANYLKITEALKSLKDQVDIESLEDIFE